MKFQAQFEEYMRSRGRLGFAMEGYQYAEAPMRIAYQDYLTNIVLPAATKTLEGLGYSYSTEWKPPMERPPVRHKKSGRLVGPARIQSDQPLSDMAAVAVYKEIATGELWVREAGEFNERFE